MREEIIDIGKRTCHIITTDSEPQCVLVKPLCSFERRLLLHECALIEQEAGKGFAMYTFEVEEAELWKDRVGELFAYIENSLIATIKARYAHLPLVVGGYSLGGLFALWTTTKTPIFDAVAACSPSLWMQGWEEYYEVHPSKAKYIYMSLGKKEEKTNKMPFKLVGDICRRQHQRHIAEVGEDHCHLQWHEGDHFTDSELRKAKGFAWCITKTTTHTDSIDSTRKTR